jgi:hypothetical protein
VVKKGATHDGQSVIFRIIAAGQQASRPTHFMVLSLRILFGVLTLSLYVWRYAVSGIIMLRI